MTTNTLEIGQDAWVTYGIDGSGILLRALGTVDVILDPFDALGIPARVVLDMHTQERAALVLDDIAGIRRWNSDFPCVIEAPATKVTADGVWVRLDTSDALYR